MLTKIHVCKSCDICHRMRIMPLQKRPYYPRIPLDYFPIESLSIDIKFMPKGFDDFKYLVDATCERICFILAIPSK